MLGRKQSTVGLDGPLGIAAGGISGVGGVATGVSGPMGTLGTDYGLDETLHGEASEAIWTSRSGPR